MPNICLMGDFHPETTEYYGSFANIVMRDEADVIVINHFEPITSDVPVAINATGIEHITAPEIISLRGEDLQDFTAVAELTIGMMIYLMRVFRQEEVKDKKIGIIGYGRIGKHVADYADNLGMWVRWHDVHPEHGLALGYGASPRLEELLSESDVVSLHITADEENRNFMDREKFEMMQDGAIFLNSARPWLVDMHDLRWASENKLAASWFDFFVSPKLGINKLVCTDHLGGTTVESTKKSEMLIAKRIKEIYGK